MQTIETRPFRWRPIAAVAAVAAAATLAVACNRPPEQPATPGAQVDAAINKAEQKAQDIGSDAKTIAADASRSAERMAGEVTDKVKDAAITTAVNAKLAGDKGLSVLRIDVDTINGRVSLRGSAPDAAARERATALATAVDGVVSVDNQLVVAGKG